MLFFVSVRGKLVCADKMYKYKFLFQTVLAISRVKKVEMKHESKMCRPPKAAKSINRREQNKRELQSISREDHTDSPFYFYTHYTPLYTQTLF